MRRARFTTLGATTATLAFLWSASALADGRGDTAECRAVRVTVRGRVSAAWQRAINQLDAAMRALPPDECKHFDLIAVSDGPPSSTGVGRGLSLTARARDGRSGGRHIERPESLGAVALGLIAELPADESTAEESQTSSANANGAGDAAAASAESPKAIVPEDLPPKDPPAPPKRERALASRVYRIAAEAGAGVRVAWPTRIAMPDFVGRLDLPFAQWFGSVAMRLAPMAAGLRSPHERFDYVELGIALGGGRRVAFTNVVLDFSLMASVTVVAQEGNPPNDAVSGVAPQLRVSPALRVLFFPTARLHPAFTLDTEITPFALASAHYIDDRIDPLPSLTVGARVALVGDVM